MQRGGGALCQHQSMSWLEVPGPAWSAFGPAHHNRHPHPHPQGCANSLRVRTHSSSSSADLWCIVAMIPVAVAEIQPGCAPSWSWSGEWPGEEGEARASPVDMLRCGRVTEGGCGSISRARASAARSLGAAFLFALPLFVPVSQLHCAGLAVRPSRWPRDCRLAIEHHPPSCTCCCAFRMTAIRMSRYCHDWDRLHLPPHRGAGLGFQRLEAQVRCAAPAAAAASMDLARGGCRTVLQCACMSGHHLHAWGFTRVELSGGFT
jgi:hypothetical protein